MNESEREPVQRDPVLSAILKPNGEAREAAVETPEALIEQFAAHVPRMSPGAALSAAATVLLKATNAAGSAVAIRKSDSEYVCSASVGKAPPVGASLDAQAGLTGLCIRTAETIHSSNIQKDPRANRAGSSSLGVQSLVVAPILRGPGQVLGIVEVFAEHAYHFCGAEIDWVQRIAALLKTPAEAQAGPMRAVEANAAKPAKEAPVSAAKVPVAPATVAATPVPAPAPLTVKATPAVPSVAAVPWVAPAPVAAAPVPAAIPMAPAIEAAVPVAPVKAPVTAMPPLKPAPAGPVPEFEVKLEAHPAPPVAKAAPAVPVRAAVEAAVTAPAEPVKPVVAQPAEAVKPVGEPASIPVEVPVTPSASVSSTPMARAVEAAPQASAPKIEEAPAPEPPRMYLSRSLAEDDGEPAEYARLIPTPEPGTTTSPKAATAPVPEKKLVELPKTPVAASTTGGSAAAAAPALISIPEPELQPLAADVGPTAVSRRMVEPAIASWSEPQRDSGSGAQVKIIAAAVVVLLLVTLGWFGWTKLRARNAAAQPAQTSTGAQASASGAAPAAMPTSTEPETVVVTMPEPAAPQAPAAKPARRVQDVAVQGEGKVGVSRNETIAPPSLDLGTSSLPMSVGGMAAPRLGDVRVADPAKLSVPPVLVRRVNPTYPQTARNMRVEGTVLVRGIVRADGSMQQVEAVSGPQALRPAAESAVRQWRYQPGTYGGNPIDYQMEIRVNFKLP